MREVAIADIALRHEAGEAGGRYLAPILILPGLFQSWVCWRGMTSMLAHRGWNSYLLPRIDEQGAAPRAGGAQGWSAAVDAAATVARNLADKVILFGADIGGAIALAALARVRPLALVLFAPVEPAVAGRAYEKTLGFFGRRTSRAGNDPVAPPAAIAKQIHRKTDLVTEPGAFIRDLAAGAALERPAEHPPAIVFAPDADPLVTREHALTFAQPPYAKTARARLVGRWWPSSGWEPIADEAHRFLILTLGDRVVEFPEEILEG